MSGGSARPKRGKAAPAALRYEHGRRSAVPAKKRDWRGCGFVLLMVLGVLAFIVPMAAADHSWGDRVWGEVAPGWPGGAYVFALMVGAVVPLALAAVIAPLSRMKWKVSRVRSLLWAAAALPGFAVCWLLSFVILGTSRPKHRRNWDSECYSTGHACWVHEQYPWIWAVGLLATLAMAALLIAALVRFTDRESRPAT
ncbi:hypothetical protein ABZ915_36250 [Streptomyces sp. NPDC046915]|uniref:hypothetical protein n=1 Tax=Streptomyces sp. NPDC046915 TaxID=3155257 RepID=UPI0033D8C38A